MQSMTEIRAYIQQELTRLEQQLPAEEYIEYPEWIALNDARVASEKIQRVDALIAHLQQQRDTARPQSQAARITPEGIYPDDAFVTELGEQYQILLDTLKEGMQGTQTPEGILTPESSSAWWEKAIHAPSLSRQLEDVQEVLGMLCINMVEVIPHVHIEALLHASVTPGAYGGSTCDFCGNLLADEEHDDYCPVQLLTYRLKQQ